MIKTNTSIIHDGVRNAVIQITGLSDSVENESNVVKVDVSQLNPPCTRVNILKITHTISRGQVTLAWDALDPVPWANLEGYGTTDYWFTGGLVNDFTPETNGTGNIVLSTSNVEPGSTYTVMLQLKKKYN